MDPFYTIILPYGERIVVRHGDDFKIVRGDDEDNIEFEGKFYALLEIVNPIEE